MLRLTTTHGSFDAAQDKRDGRATFNTFGGRRPLGHARDKRTRATTSAGDGAMPPAGKHPRYKKTKRFKLWHERPPSADKSRSWIIFHGRDGRATFCPTTAAGETLLNGKDEARK